MAESVGLTFIVAGAIFAAGRARYESKVTLSLDAGDTTHAVAPPAAAKRLLAQALHYADEPPLADPTMPRIFRVDVLLNQQLQLVCEAEQRSLAEALCKQAATDGAAQLNELRVVAHSAARVLVRRRLFDAAWPALLAGIGWWLVRTSRRVPAAEEFSRTVREYGRWSVPNQTVTNPIPATGASVRRPAAARRPGQIATTIVGMPAVAAGLQRMSRDSIELSDSGAARVVPVDAPPQPAVRGAPAPATRVIYHVGTGAWSADPGVLTDQPKGVLRGLCDEIYRETDALGRVIRVVSPANSRYAKSQVSAHLACLLAERKGRRTLLVEADLDAPALHKVMRLNVPRGFGLSEQLERMASHSDPFGDADVSLLRVAKGLHALVESRFGTPPLFDTPNFSAIIHQQRQMHDAIVIDGPVVDDWPDPQTFASIADLVVFVISAGTSLADAQALATRHFENNNVMRIIKTGEWPDA